MSTKLGSLTLDLICRTGRFTQGMRDASNSASREMGRIESSTQAVNSMFKQLAATAAATFTVSQVVNYADSYTGMVNKLKLVTTTQTDLSRAMIDTHKIAQGSASDWASVVDVYTKFQKISDRLGLSQKEVARITETVTKSVGMSGASADEAQRSLIQFSQGLSLGVLRGQDLNSVMAQTPALTDAIAKGMGVTSDKLKQMGADNTLTTEAVVNALKKVADYVDEDYAKTATTVASSFNLIKNESIRMIGEFDSATGASAKFVTGMTLLSKNMDTVTSTMMIGGAYMVGSYIPAIAIGTKTLITDTVVKVASIAAARSKAIADYDVAKSNLAATAAMVQAMGVTNAQTAAMMTNARTAYQQAAAAKSAALANSTLSSVLLGPVGLGVAVASVAAGFLLMRDSSKDTQDALEEQGLTVDELKVKYSQLNAEQLKLKALGASDAIEAENDKIASSLTSLKQYISDLNAQGESDQAKALQTYLTELKAGGERAKTAFANLEKQNIVSPHSLKMAAEVGSTVKTSNKEIDKQNQILSIASNKHIDHAKAAKTGAEGVAQFGKEAVGSAAQIKGLSTEVQKFINETLNNISSNSEVLALRAKGISKEYAEGFVKLRQMQGLIGKDAPVDMGAFNLLLADLSIKEKIKNLDDQQAKSEKDRTKELEKQQNVLRLSSQILSNASKYNFGAIEAKNGLPSGTLSAIHAIETGNTGLTNQVNKETGATGGFQFLAGTAKQYGVNDRKDLAQSAVGAGKYMGYLLKLFKGDLEKAVRAYHAGEGNVQRGTNIGKYNNDYWAKFQGFVAGKSGYTGSSEDFNDSLKTQTEYLQKTIQEIDQLREQYSNADVVRNKKRIAEISEAERLGQTQLISKINERYSNESRLAELQFEEQINGFNWSEDEKLKNQAEINKAQISLSTELNDIQKQLAKESIDDHLAYSLEKSKLAKEQRLLQSKEFYMSELQMAKAKYDIERRLLDQSNEDPKEKAFKSQMLALQNHVDMNRRLKDASTGWDAIQAQMNGSTGRYQVSQDKFSRMGASQNLFDTQMADVENQEQEPGADLQKLAEVREQIWAAHNQRMIDIENQYQTDSLNLQLTQAQQLTGSFANMFKGILGESSGAYKTMFAMQQGFAIAQAGINLYSSASKAYNESLSPTVWGRMADAAKAMLDQGTFLAMIQAITPQGFATGGQVIGPGTGTSDSILAYLSNGEHVATAWAVNKIGVANYDYMNRTGELPFQREYLAMKSQYLGSTQPDLNVQKFKDGGLVGVSRINNADVENRSINSLLQRSSQISNMPEPTISISQTITFDTSNGTAKIDTQGQKDVAQSLNNMMDNWARRASMQGGVLYKLVRSVK